MNLDQALWEDTRLRPTKTGGVHGGYFVLWGSREVRSEIANEINATSLSQSFEICFNEWTFVGSKDLVAQADRS